MAVNKHKSKRRSSANVLAPPDSYIFFTDANLGRRVVPSALRAAGEEVKVYDELFSPGLVDREWLRIAGEKEWIVLSSDPRIDDHRSQMIELLAAQLRVFVFVSEKSHGTKLANIFVKALTRMKQLCQKHNRPFVAHVHANGRIVMSKRPKKRPR
ncbi:MAG: hypothetical protein QOH39_832 [Verrucomicrobiota bacterium]